MDASPCGRGQPLASNQPHSTSLRDVIGLRDALTVKRQVKLADGMIKGVDGRGRSGWNGG